MACYFFVNIAIHDPAEYDRYLARAGEVFSRHGGRYLAVDSAPARVEGEWPYSRAVLIEFPDEASFAEWYHSPEYQEILRHRLSAAQCDAILVHGKQSSGQAGVD